MRAVLLSLMVLVEGIHQPLLTAPPEVLPDMASEQTLEMPPWALLSLHYRQKLLEEVESISTVQDGLLALVLLGPTEEASTVLQEVSFPAHPESVLDLLMASVQ